MFYLILDKVQIYAIEDITSYFDFEDLKNAEQVSSEWAEIFLNFGMWGTLLKCNVSPVPLATINSTDFYSFDSQLIIIIFLFHF